MPFRCLWALDSIVFWFTCVLLHDTSQRDEYFMLVFAYPQWRMVTTIPSHNCTGDVCNHGNKGSDLIGSLEPYHFASSPVSAELAWCDGTTESTHQGGAAISSVPGSMSSASSGGSITTDKNAPFKSESTSDLDLVPKVIQEDISDDKGHQRSFSLGETKKMAKQFSLASNEQEKKSVKTLLSNLLSGSGTDPIQMPFSVDEHHIIKQTPPSIDTIAVIIYDQEPSSIISYALSSPEYEKKLQELSMQQMKEETKDSPYTRRKYTDSATSSSDGQDQSESNLSRKSMLSFFRGASSSGRDRSPIHQGSARVCSASAKSFDIEAVKYTPSKEKDSSEDIDEPDFAFFSQNSDKCSAAGVGMKSNKEQTDNCHIELQFSDNTANFYCKVYFADKFRKLRQLLFPAGEERYIRSLSRCFTWLVKGGKSGSSFCKTQDDRFILKQMSRYEVHSFVKFAPHYFSYITKAQIEQKPTVLAKILGVYRIGYRNSQTSSESKQDLLVMENLFYDREITQIFDLKGSLRNRLVTTVGKRMEDLVLLDENLLKLSVDSPLYIRPHSKTVLSLAVANDTQFLASHLIMDYSLLVGLDEKRQELVLGIIDYIRTFTWDKKLEMVVKSTYSQLGGQGKMPTVIYPESYRSRFIQSMDRYFLPVPDRWAGLGRNVDC
ncbi:hypothetical protein LSH36_51g02007 [Paralvinella palmiformis]|uniref:PIPK domain-containing protein n=1 Tax=Paralvinella palmiformis TaxID=53620 RepID=A0AAD9NCW4_9ANNE|nr:hypothetical protein LSH36_51g02007 [Paralvinella palmiformis]